MTHTLPDYSTKYKMVKVFGNVDNAEMAARTNGLSMLDRRGQVVWWDDFEDANAAKWYTDADGAGSVALSTERAWMGNQSLKTVTDVNTDDRVFMGKQFSLPPSHRMGMEIMFTITGGAPYVIFNFTGYTGAYKVTMQLKYDHNLLKLYYLNSADAWVELAVNDYTSGTQEQWIYIKLVVDWDLREYIRAIFCGTEYDLSGIGARVTASATLPFIGCYYSNNAATDAAATIYWDNFIFTQNE